MSGILFLSSWFPYPANNGSKLRVLGLLRGLAQAHDVTLLSFADEPDANPNAPELQAICRDVQVVPWRPFEPARRGRVMPGLTPRSIAETHSPEMEHRIRQTLARDKFDTVIASQLNAAGYAGCFQGLPALFEEVELGVLYEQFANARSLARRARHGMTWAKHRRYVARVLRHYRACTVASERERDLVMRSVPGYQAVHVIPNCIDLGAYADVPRAPEPNTLIFTGSFRYWANHDAMVWFLNEVYPRIAAHIPEVQLKITGDPANRELPEARNVTLTGQVDDVRPLIASAAASVVPLRVGGGTRLKILEAMALRTPVVATAKGAEGLEARRDEHLLIADTPDEFAHAVVRILQEPGLRERLAENAYRLVRAKYDWAAVVPRFLEIVDRVARAQ